ncbi:hypothetical protein OJ997_15065 [Solirubrobacter phytolaccae]|uniref:Uncharacterized protein n=1 Tax=Solirubrobacter phytolaccae TaxID=1404360 RepID=A0A9X3S805_9ACTN|nr:hypothetical protein [Solirubrobacter phytolaccae]MDA0181624.1 hypothetical protein [Solirubrobacter phytolaccae]
MKRFLLTSLLLLAAPAGAAAQTPLVPSLSIDTTFAPLSGIATDDYSASVASDIPAEVIAANGRIYTIGSTSADDGNLYVVARRGDGTFDASFSGDGRLTVSVPGTEAENVKAAAVLPNGALRIAASADKSIGSSSDRDVAIIGLLPDGSLDPSFGSGGITLFPVGAGDDDPNGIAVDGVGRVAVTGSALASNVKDTFVSLRNPDGSPAAFGTGGVVVLQRSPSGLADEGQDVVFRPGGGLAVLMSVHLPGVGADTDETSVLRGFTEDGSLDPGFGDAGETALTVGSPDTSAPGLMLLRNRLWVTGKTMSGVQQMAFIARTEANGTGLQSRQFEMRGKSSGTDAIRSAGADLAVLAGPPEALVVVGSSVTPSSGLGGFAATAFTNFDGDLASAPASTYVDAGSNQTGLVSASAEGPYSLAAAGLLLNSSSFDTSFATLRLLLDADKKCDLAIDVPTPLELTFVGRKGTAAQISVENKGDRPCGGPVTVNAPYKLGRAVDTGVIAAGAKFVVNAVPLTSSTIRRDDDVARFTVSATGGDSDTSNDVRGVRAVYSFCDLALSAVQKPSTIPNEGGRRVEVGLRNSGTRTCRSVRMKVTDGSGEGASKPYSIDRGRSVSDDVLVSAKSAAKIGKKATVRVTTSSSDDDVFATNDAIRLTARVVGVGDTRVSSAGATRIAGSASRGKGTKADAKGLSVTRVEVAVRKLGSGCRWLSGKNAKFTNRKLAKGATCTPSGWQAASGRSSWRLSMRALPKGSYEVYSRAVTANGFREGRFAKADGNRRSFRVR